MLIVGAEADVQTVSDRLRGAHIDMHLTPPLALATLAMPRATTSPLPSGGALPTVREREIAALTADGLQNNQIASRLNLRPTTVRTHLRHIFRRLGIASRAQLAAWVTDNPPTTGGIRKA